MYFLQGCPKIFLLFAIFTIEGGKTFKEETEIEKGESMKSIDLRQCFEKQRLTGGFSSNFFSEPSSKYKKWCLRAFTDRNVADSKRLLGLTSWVEFSWYRLDSDQKSKSPPIPCWHGNMEIEPPVNSSLLPCRDVRPTCAIAHDGYRGEYRLSPDFGLYPECSGIPEEYFFKLRNQTAMQKNRLPIGSMVRKLNIGIQSKQKYEPSPKRGCPLKSLPFTLNDFNTCTLQPEAWYVLEFRSYARWENENGSFVVGIGKGESRLLRTYEPKDEMYLSHSQVTGCLFKSIILLRHVLPFALRINVDVHVKNDKNAVRQIYKEDIHEIGTRHVGKEFTYKLPPGSKIVRYCQMIEAKLDDFHINLPGEDQKCIARNVPDCPLQDTSHQTSSTRCPVSWSRLALWTGIILARYVVQID